MLGPHVVRALEADHRLRLTDINDLETEHEYLKLDVSDTEQVVTAAQGMDAIINLSVLRNDRKLAFDVSARGCYNVMRAAVRHGIPRVINTGPHFTIAGPSYETLDYMIGPDIPPQPGTGIYPITKSLGQEICRVFTESHDLHVITLLFYHFYQAESYSADRQGLYPYSVSWSDAAESFRCALSADAERLPSRCEVFYVFADLPHQKFSNEKARRVLGWEPKDRLTEIWRRLVMSCGRRLGKG